MKAFLPVVFLALAALGTKASSDAEMLAMEEAFEEEFHVLSNNEETKKEKAKALDKSIKEIIEHNAKGDAMYVESLNKLSNVPKERLEKEHMGVVMPEGEIEANGRTFGALELPANHPDNRAIAGDAYLNALLNYDVRKLPTSYDARTYYGVISPVTSQGSCGSCVSFATVSHLETCIYTANRQRNGVHPDLSEQYFVDCGYNNKTSWGCNGAYPHSYVKFIDPAHGGAGRLPYELTYPYESTNSKLVCKTKAGDFYNAGAEVKSSHWYYDVENDNLLKMIIYLQNSAVSAMYASDRSFLNYAGGIYDGCTSTKTSHAILVVGFGQENGTDYWIIKNSWGKSWGENGFAKVKMGTCGLGKNVAFNRCGNTGAADPIPTTTLSPPSNTCDLSITFRKYRRLTGAFKVSITRKGVRYADRRIRCVNHICRINDPYVRSGTDACEYVCGARKCT